MTDIHLYIQRLLDANPLREPVLRSAIRALQLPAGSHGLDAGCGVGLQTVLLADAVGPQGHITGLDIMPELLAYGSEMVGKAGLSERIAFQQGDVSHLPFDDAAFDWVWSADCIGYPAGDLSSLLRELVRVVKPGGSVILLGWSSQQVLPGYPLLEARLNAAHSAYIPFLKGQPVESHFLRAPQRLREAGLEAIRAQTFVGEVRSPLTAGQRQALISLFEMLWEPPQPILPAQPDGLPEDWLARQRLCTQGSPDFILDIPDYYAFFTYSMFWGNVPLA